jgi:transcriptional regulator of acetoin/glycerol metabolism
VRRRDDVPEGLVRDLYRDGLSIDEIAARTGLHRITVWKRLRRAGVPMRPRGNSGAVAIGELARRIEAGERVPDVAADLGITEHAVYIRMRRHGLPVGLRPDPRRGGRR